jgi:hypothetical protein
MKLRKLPFNKSTTIAAMINKIMEFDKKLKNNFIII